MEQSNFKKICLLILLGLGLNQTQGQTLQEFKYFDYPYSNELYIGASLSYSMASNPAAPFPDLHKKQGTTGMIDLKKGSFEPYKLRFTYKNKLVVDLFTLLGEAIHNDPDVLGRSVESGLTTGPLGWMNFVYNVVSKDRHSLALGFNLNDYFLTSTYSSDTTSNGWVSLEPQGYFFAAGPSVSYNYLLSKHLFLEINSMYSIPYFQAASLSYATKNENYPHPHFVHFNWELQSAYGFFIGTDYNFILNKGNIPNKTRRFDLLFGFRFMI